MMFLLHDSLVARARYLGGVSRGSAPAGPEAGAGVALRARVGGLRQAWRHFRQYRRAVARAAADED